jgi:hypothetical protein
MVRRMPRKGMRSASSVGGWECGRSFLVPGGGLDVAGGDSAADAGAGDVLDVNAEIAGEASDGGGGADLAGRFLGRCFAAQVAHHGAGIARLDFRGRRFGWLPACRFGGSGSCGF